jgi:transcriptional regulator with XRE-family HTH domain
MKNISISGFNEILVQKYKQLKNERQEFSQRAFARFLGISQGYLRNILLAKRSASEKVIRRIMTIFEYSEAEIDSIIELEKRHVPLAYNLDTVITNDYLSPEAIIVHEALAQLGPGTDKKQLSRKLEMTESEIENHIDELRSGQLLDQKGLPKSPKLHLIFKQPEKFKLHNQKLMGFFEKFKENDSSSFSVYYCSQSKIQRIRDALRRCSLEINAIAEEENGDTTEEQFFSVRLGVLKVLGLENKQKNDNCN